jgi:hypothetical protein
MNIDVQFSVDAAGLKLLERRTVTNMLRAAKDGLDEVSKQAERALEAVSAQAGLGKLAKSWKRDLFPLGNRLAYAPSADIYPQGSARTEGAMRAFSQGADIRAGAGKLLPIPTPAARQFARSNKRLSPAEFERVTGIKLRGFYSKARGVLLLVADNVRQLASGRIRSNVRTRKDGSSYSSLNGAATVVVFICVPFVRLDKRFDIASTVRPAAQQLAQRVESKFRLLNSRSNAR